MLKALRQKSERGGCALSDPRYSLLVLDGLDDVFAGGGAGGQEASEDPDKETGEKGC